jgi:hypothetical protein
MTKLSSSISFYGELNTTDVLSGLVTLGLSYLTDFGELYLRDLGLIYLISLRICT